MPEHHDHDPAYLALLYSSGELEGEEAAAFEARLAVDQEAREALAQVVQLGLTAAGKPTRPDPAWRDETALRLQQRRSLWQRLAGKRVYRGHPIVWSMAGALAATVVLTLMTPPPMPHDHVSNAVPVHAGQNDIQLLEQKAQQLARELEEVNQELERAKKNSEKRG